MGRFAARIYGELEAALTTSRTLSSDIIRVPGSQKQGPEDYEHQNGRAPLTAKNLALKEMEEELKSQKQAQKVMMEEIKR